MTKAGRFCSWPYDDFDIIAWATAMADSAPAKTTNFLDVISIAISLLASTSIGDARNEGPGSDANEAARRHRRSNDIAPDLVPRFHGARLVPGITNRYCGPSFETATEPVIGRAFARPA